MTDNRIAKLELDLEEKAKVAGMSTAELLMLGFAVGRTPNEYQDLFETLLDRKLSVEEQCELADLEGDQYLFVEKTNGPLEAEVA